MKPRIRRHRRRRHKPSTDHFFQKEGQDTVADDTPKPFFELPTVQAKMEIGQTDSPMERQADAVADQVVNHEMNVMRTQEEGPQANHIQKMEEEEPQAKMIHRMEEEEELQAKAEASPPQPSKSFETKLKNKKGQGNSLPQSTLQEMNQSFGSDFRSVSVHTDDVAQRMNQQIQAQAFTHGKDIFFNKGKFDPSSKEGKHLLAHELTHVIQQNHKIRRDEDDDAPKTWSEKVTDVEALSGNNQNSGYKGLIQEAIGSGYSVHESTNDVAKLVDAAKQGKYTEWGENKDVNYDANLNTKTGDANQYGQAQYVTDDDSTKIYIVLGPNAVNKVGPEFTQMANDHEQGHANDYKTQIANDNLHAATEGEELAIYTHGFTTYFLDLFVLDKTECSYNPTEAFFSLFEAYKGAEEGEQTTAFSAIESFYKDTVKGDSDKEIAFKIWFQLMLNDLGTDHPLVKKINALDGLGFKKGTDELDHFECTPS